MPFRTVIGLFGLQENGGSAGADSTGAVNAVGPEFRGTAGGLPVVPFA